MKKGFTLLELIIATTMLAIGVLSMGLLFPTGMRSANFTRQNTKAIEYCQQQLEYLRTLPTSSTELNAGTHPAETLETKFIRTYTITDDHPVNDMKMIEVFVRWTQNVSSGSQHVQSIKTYINSQ